MASTWWKLWTVDRFGGGLAYIDDENENKDVVHLVGVTGKTAPLTTIDQSIPAKVTPKAPPAATPAGGCPSRPH
ncbi:hypothetical protein OG625_38435 [Streptomyces sp. NBC_01351]|uniref:hypothetical protein n=1 Tax=Streptomyces sp. NBC_01351 TaxID=2903833 RepID=UPI002E362F62|nr:hypothetical protein [Streptomyces sp. NBC_01351]